MSAPVPDEPPSAVDVFDEGPNDLPITTGYRIANQVAGALIAIIGGATTLEGLRLGLDSGGVMGPGAFPSILGSILLVLGVVLFVMASVGRLDRSHDTALPDRGGVRRILITALATGVFLWALFWVGYTIAMTLYVFALLLFVGQRKWLSSAIISVAFGAITYFGFTVGLGLILPTSAFPFIRAIGL